VKALTITQPWATLIAQGQKRIETRSWSTNYRGPLAIHAGKNLPGWVADFVRSVPEFTTVLGDLFDPRKQVLGDLPRGCIVATCQLVAVKFIPLDCDGWDWIGPSGRRFDYTITDRERAFGDFTVGRYAWLLGDVRPLEQPIFVRGALGLWDTGSIKDEHGIPWRWRDVPAHENPYPLPVG
jgi:hypothetical protein